MRTVNISCDRCGKTIGGGDALFHRFDATQTNIPKYPIYEINMTPYETSNIDLCESCQAELYEWIHGAKEGSK